MHFPVLIGEISLPANCDDASFRAEEITHQKKVRGLHLHQSLSGEHVEQSRGFIPQDFTGTYEQRFASSYRHILNIDRHEPWTDPGVADLVRHIGPEWVTSELSFSSRAEHNERLRTQLAALAS